MGMTATAIRFYTDRERTVYQNISRMNEVLSAKPAYMVLCDVTKNGYKVKASVLTEKLESLSPSEREKILQMVDIMLDGK